MMTLFALETSSKPRVRAWHLGGGTARVVLLLVLTLYFGCEHSSAVEEVAPKYPRANWKAKSAEFFVDPSLQSVCDAITSHDLAQLKKIAAGVDLNTTGTLNMSLPFWAYLEGNIDALMYLLENGASPDHRLSEDLKLRRSPVVDSTKNRNLIQHAFKNMDTRSAFFRIGVLHTTDPNQDVSPGYSLLHWYSGLAMSKSSIEDLIKLIGKGVALDSKTSRGETACHLASQSSPCALLVLVLAGADWKIPFPDGSLLLDVVRKKSHPHDNELHYQYLTVLYWLELESKRK